MAQPLVARVQLAIQQMQVRAQITLDQAAAARDSLVELMEHPDEVDQVSSLFDTQCHFLQ
jgi:hypothetical protein